MKHDAMKAYEALRRTYPDAGDWRVSIEVSTDPACARVWAHVSFGTLHGAHAGGHDFTAALAKLAEKVASPVCGECGRPRDGHGGGRAA